MASLLLLMSLSPISVVSLPLSFDSVDALMAAQANGTFNQSGSLSISLQPGIYALSETLLLSAPTVELVGAGPGVELRCANAPSAIVINATSNLLLRGLLISHCSGAVAVQMTSAGGSIGRRSNVTLDSMNLNDNSNGAVTLVAAHADVTWLNCRFANNTCSSAVSGCKHALSVTLVQSGTMALDHVSLNGNGQPSSSYSAMQLICSNGPSTCRLGVINSTFESNLSDESNPTIAITGFGSATVNESSFVSNEGSSTLSFTHASVDITPSEGAGADGAYDIQIVRSIFTGNKVGSSSTLSFVACGMALVRNTSFGGNVASFASQVDV